ncbi:MAG: ABC transporter substrate-binding protein [Mycobacteriales bacterium]
MVSRSSSGVLALVLAVSTVATSAACIRQSEAKLELVIGANLELSGADAQLGQAHRNAMELAVRHHAGGRVAVTVVYRDNASDPERARQIMQGMLESDDIDVVVGGGTTRIAAVMAETASGNDKPVMLLAPDVGPIDPLQRPNVFATSAGPDVIADATLSQLRQTGSTRVAILSSQDEYGRAGAEEFKGKAPDFEISVIDSQTFGGDAQREDDLLGPVGSVSDDDADAVVVWSPRVRATALARLLRAADVDQRVYFASGVGSQALLGESAAEGMSVICPTIAAAGSIAATTPGLLVQQRFFMDYTSRFGVFVPDAATASDAVGVFAQAAADAGSGDADQLREQLQDLSYSGVAGAYEFTGTRHNGLARSSFTTVTARSGSWSQA